MHIEHINLVVKDIDNSIKFYSLLFPHWLIRAKGEANWYGTQRNWVHFGDDYNYITLNDKGFGMNRDLHTNNIGIAHIGYITTHLDALIERMRLGNFKPTHFGPKNKFRKNAYFVDPDGNEIEFVEYLSDLPNERNNTE